MTDTTFEGFTSFDSNFSMIPNEYFDVLTKTLNGSSHKIAGLILRLTLGFHKPLDWICNKRLADLAGVSINTVISSVKKAEDKGAIIKYKFGPRGLEKNYYFPNTPVFKKTMEIVKKGKIDFQIILKFEKDLKREFEFIGRAAQLNPSLNKEECINNLNAKRLEFYSDLIKNSEPDPVQLLDTPTEIIEVEGLKELPGEVQDLHSQNKSPFKNLFLNNKLQTESNFSFSSIANKFFLLITNKSKPKKENKDVVVASKINIKEIELRDSLNKIGVTGKEQDNIILDIGIEKCQHWLNESLKDDEAGKVKSSLSGWYLTKLKANKHVSINAMKKQKGESGEKKQSEKIELKRSITEKFKPAIELWSTTYFKMNYSAYSTSSKEILVTEFEAKTVLARTIKEEFSRYKAGYDTVVKTLPDKIKKTTEIIDLKDCFLEPDENFINELLQIMIKSV
jgi:hypothetical protein